MSYSENNSIIGVINAGTKYLVFSLFLMPDFELMSSYKQELAIISPKTGWYEQDPLEIISAINICTEEAIKNLRRSGYNDRDIVAIGITNQHETTIAWDAITSKPLYNAIIWKDIRTVETVEKMKKKLPDLKKLKYVTGLPMSTFFSAYKMRWLLDNVTTVATAYQEQRCKFGTLDTWIIWQLTNAALHVTDVTNASRTMLMNLRTENWDSELLLAFDISVDTLPVIHSCSEIYGIITRERSWLHGCRITGVIGNQQASLLGQFCIRPGEIKCSYRSGAFVICNTGETLIRSSNGLISTIAFKLGRNGTTFYAVEGDIAVAGHTFTWLTENIRLLSEFDAAEETAAKVANTGGVYFVPAFTGLYAPYWNAQSRGIIIGLTQYTTKGHLVRAALESICFQVCDILMAIRKYCGYKITNLLVDGDITCMKLMMQLQADISGINVVASEKNNAIPLGAAFCAAFSKGINLALFDPNKCFHKEINYQTFYPKIDETERTQRYDMWKRTVNRTFGWVGSSSIQEDTQKNLRFSVANNKQQGRIAQLQHSNSPQLQNTAAINSNEEQPDEQSRRERYDYGDSYCVLL